MKTTLLKYFIYIILIIGSLGIIYPIFWVLITSLKSNQDFFQNIWGLPQDYMFENYLRAWTVGKIDKRVLSSVIVTGGSLIFTCYFASTTAYVLARFKFKGSELIRTVFMSTLMIPGLLAIVPQYMLFFKFNLLDKHIGLVLLYSMCGLAFSQFLLYGFFKTIPFELEESAYIDGATYFQTFFKIIFPLIKPALITLIIIKFIDYWNEYFYAMLFLTSDSKFTLPVGLANLLSEAKYRTEWGPLMAANVILLAPTLVFYIIFQGKIIKGLTSGSVKG
jgi:N-acetylglucosamine transport system permease protein